MDGVDTTIEGGSRARREGTGTARDRHAPGPAPHRRRRLAAVGVAAAVAFIIGVVIGAGSGGGGRHRVAHAPVAYFMRLKRLAGAGTGSFAAVEHQQEDAAIDRTLAYTPFVRIAGSQHREIALTFDDGPGPYTLHVLRVLDRLHTPATFFEVGLPEEYFHAGTTAIVAHGDPIGDHTETHPEMIQLSAQQQQGQLLEETRAIGRYGAPFPRMYRPPYGLWNSTTLALLKRYRMLMVLWTVDTSDWQLPGANKIVQRTLSGARPGAIILMHDAGGNRSETIAALPRVIRGLRARGYKLVTVPRLLLDNPAPRDQDVTMLQGAGG